MDIKHYYENTKLTQKQISAKLKIGLNQVIKYIKNNYSSDYRKNRKSISYRNSKLGSLNPMKGNFLEKHPRYIGDVSDQKGYLERVKPSWYTGRKGSKHVFTHHIIVCENLKLTKIPKGWCVHHCDFNPTNNEFNNLVLMTTSDHMKLHNYLKGVTTISKESTLKWVEAHGTPWSYDIVSSSQECEAVNTEQKLTNSVEDK